jgi:hypothetical protein
MSAAGAVDVVDVAVAVAAAADAIASRPASRSSSRQMKKQHRSPHVRMAGATVTMAVVDAAVVAVADATVTVALIAIGRRISRPTAAKCSTPSLRLRS